MNLYVKFNESAIRFGYVDFAWYNNLTSITNDGLHLIVIYAYDGFIDSIPLEFIESFEINLR